MSVEEVVVERYVVKKGMHLGALRADIRNGDKLEYFPQTGQLKINGRRIEEQGGVSPSGAMRQLKALQEKNPEEKVLEEIFSSEDLTGGPLKTSTLCVLPILGCLEAAEKYLEEKGGSPERAPATDEQARFLESFEDLLEDLSSIEEIKSMASESVEEVNAWLRDGGFDIQLPKGGGDEFAVASILDVLLKWMHVGNKTTIRAVSGEEFIGVKLEEGVKIAHLAEKHHHPVVRIATQSGDTVCMSMVDEVPEGFAGLFLKVADLEEVQATSHSYKGVCFPMVDLDEKPDISFINGLEVGEGFRITSAMQQTKFRMNEKGARVESAAAAKLFRSAVTQPLVPHMIDRPFLLWIMRDGVEFPLFAALLCEDVWKEPKDL